jgi:hypothetical protein
LIGLNIGTNEVVVLSSQQVWPDSLSDLAAMIRAPASVPA